MAVTTTPLLSKGRPRSCATGGVSTLTVVPAKVVSPVISAVAFGPGEGGGPGATCQLILRPLVNFRPHDAPVDAPHPGPYRFTSWTDRYEVAARDIPPLAEVGVPGFDWAAWQAVAVPGATPKEVVAKLNSAINAALAEPEVTKQLVDLQFIPLGKGTPEELDRFVKSETARWARVLQQAGVAGTE